MECKKLIIDEIIQMLEEVNDILLLKMICRILKQHIKKRGL